MSANDAMTAARQAVAELRRIASAVGPQHAAWDTIHDVEAKLRAVAPSGWLPIDTAPKDGTAILAWGTGWSRPDVMFWVRKRNGSEFWSDALHWDPIPLPVEEQQPTHWLPIPLPPK